MATLVAMATVREKISNISYQTTEPSVMKIHNKHLYDSYTRFSKNRL